MQKFKFIKKIEKMISPQDIATLQMIAPLSRLMPKSLQNKIITSSSDKNPYMGFVVEPYSFFLCYEITDLEYAQSLLPDGFELVKTQILTDDTPKYYCIFTCYNLHTSAFWGTRLEVNIIAKSKKSGLTSWVIVDYDTNTLSHDIANGLTSKTTSQAILTTDFAGNMIVDIVNEDKNRGLVVDCNIKNSTNVVLNHELWMQGNLSIGYGKEISNNSDEVFSLKFDPLEVETGFVVDTQNLNIDRNDWYPDMCVGKPDFVVYFEFAQHFMSDSPGHLSETKSEADMLEQMQALDLDNVPNYSAAPLRKMLKYAIIFNICISWTLIILIISFLVDKF